MSAKATAVTLGNIALSTYGPCGRSVVELGRFTLIAQLMARALLVHKCEGNSIASRWWIRDGDNFLWTLVYIGNCSTPSQLGNKQQSWK